MTYIEIQQQNSTNIFIGEIKFDECQEIIDIIDYLAFTGVKA